MKTELLYLVLVASFTGLLWVPYVLNRFATWGIEDTVGYPTDPPPLSPWAERLRKAHANAIENLAVFATLVLAANAAGLSNGIIGAAATWYFWARIAHAAAYTFAVPWVRTLAFSVGFFAQAAIAWQLLLR